MDVPIHQAPDNSRAAAPPFAPDEPAAQAVRVLLGRRGFGLLSRKGATPTGLIFLGTGSLGALLVGLFGIDRLPVTLCTFKAITGIPCPTCGSTRVLGRLAALDLAGAVAMNPLAAAVGGVLLLWGLGDLLLLRRGEALTVEAGPKLSKALWISGGVAALANWVWLIFAGR